MNFKSALKTFFGRLRGYFPSPLPQGVTEFNAFVDSISTLYKPKMDPRSVRFVVSSLIMRMGPAESWKSKYFFAKSLHRGAASQVAVYIQEEIKNEQKAEQAAAQLEAEKSQAEAATSPQANS